MTCEWWMMYIVYRYSTKCKRIWLLHNVMSLMWVTKAALHEFAAWPRVAPAGCVVKPRLRLHASMMSSCLSVCLSPKCKKTRFSQKLSNLELRCLLTTIESYVSLTGLFNEPIIGSLPTIQDGWDLPSWKLTSRHFFLPRVVRFG